MHKKKNYNISNIEILNATSCTECAGLIPSAPKSEEEYNSYFDIMNFSPKQANKFENTKN